MRKNLNRLALLTTLALGGVTVVQAATNCCSDGKCGTCCVKCTKCGAHCSPKTCCK
jgi:hypothetical protein